MEPDWIIHLVLCERPSSHTHGLDKHGSLELELNLPLVKKSAGMQGWKIRQATEQFHNLEAWYLDRKLPEGTLGLSITEQGIVQSGALVYIKNESLDDYLARNQCTEVCHCPVSPYAYLSDYGWSEFCDVSVCGKENAEQVWNRMVQEFIATLPEESMLVYVDCHI